MKLVSDKIQTQKGSNKRLFILTQTHSMQILGEIPFIKPQNNNFGGNPLYQATKWHLNNRQMVKNDEKLKKKTYLVLVNLLINYICMKKIMQQTSQWQKQS